jgi:hypothetical protein
MKPRQQAAAEIIALINSKPRTPTQEELAAIIGTTTAVPSLSENGRADLLRWDAIVREYLDAMEALEDDDADDDDLELRLSRALCARAEAIWAQPVRGWEDVILRAAVSVYWNSGRAKLSYPDFVIAKDDRWPSMDDRSVAFLVRAILDLAGLSFDHEGRTR